MIKKKNLNKVGLEGTYLNIIKAMYDKPTASIILNGKKWQKFSLILGTRQGYFTSLIQQSTGSPSHSNQTRRNKRHPNWKEEVTLSLSADDMILYIENPRDSTKKLLELINEFSKVAGYKINILKSDTFLYANMN